MPKDIEYEKDLVRRASHDPKAFRTLYELYFNRVYSYVATRVDHHQDAEDLVSDIFVQIIEGLDRFNNRYEFSFAAWVFTIARNTVIDFYRKRSRTVQEMALTTVNDLPTFKFDPAAVLIERENHSELRTLLQYLPGRRREVVMLRYFGGLRNQEIAAIMGIDERTVASHLSRGLKDLYKAYVKEA